MISSGPGWGGWPVLVSAMGGLGGGAQHAADLAGGGGRVGDGADSLGPGPVERGMVGGDVVADVGVAAGDVQPFWPAGGGVQGGGGGCLGAAWSGQGDAEFQNSCMPALGVRWLIRTGSVPGSR